MVLKIIKGCVEVIYAVCFKKIQELLRMKYLKDDRERFGKEILTIVMLMELYFSNPTNPCEQ